MAILLCVAMGLADAALAVHAQSTVTPAFVMLAGMTFGQLTLLAVWCVSGSGPWIVRVLATLPAVAGLAALVAPATAASRSGWFVALGAYWLIATLGMWGITATTRQLRAESQRGRWQYSLSGLLSVITLLSVSMAMTHWVCFSWPQLASFAGGQFQVSWTVGVLEVLRVAQVGRARLVGAGTGEEMLNS